MTDNPLSETHPTLWKQRTVVQSDFISFPSNTLWVQFCTVDVKEHERILDSYGVAEYGKGFKDGKDVTLRRVKKTLLKYKHKRNCNCIDVGCWGNIDYTVIEKILSELGLDEVQ